MNTTATAKLDRDMIEVLGYCDFDQRPAVRVGVGLYAGQNLCAVCLLHAVRAGNEPASVPACGGEWAPASASLQQCVGCGAVRAIPDDCVGEHAGCDGDHVTHTSTPASGRGEA